MHSSAPHHQAIRGSTKHFRYIGYLVTAVCYSFFASLSTPSLISLPDSHYRYAGRVVDRHQTHRQCGYVFR